MIGQCEQQVLQTLFARVQELFSQVGFKTDAARKEVVDESIQKARLRAEQVDHMRLRDDQDLRCGHRNRALRPLATAGERRLSQKRPRVQETADRLPAVARRDANHTRPLSMNITLSQGSP